MPRLALSRLAGTREQRPIVHGQCDQVARQPFANFVGLHPHRQCEIAGTELQREADRDFQVRGPAIKRCFFESHAVIDRVPLIAGIVRAVAT